MKKVKLGVIGLGRLGYQHARNISLVLEETELVAVCSLVEKELDYAKENLNASYFYTDYHELLKNQELDGIVIATNSQTHCEIICAAIEAGVKNIYTEKPVGLNMEELDRTKAIVDKNKDVSIQVGYNRRFDTDLMEAKQKIDEGFIGTPILYRLEARDQKGNEDFIVKFSPTSGGCIADMLTHDYDTARWFTGSEADTIYGVGDVFGFQGLRACGDIDNVAVLMKFKSGPMVFLTASRNSSYGYHAPMEVFGTDGCIKIGDYSYNNKNTYLNDIGVVRNCSEWFYDYWQPSYPAEMKGFAESISKGTTPKVTFLDGYKAMEWAFLADRAVKNQEVIKL